METLRLDQLKITNFRCFGTCEVNLHPKLTVLVAENGQGKTGILDAVAIALGPIVDQLAGTRQWDGVSAGDVRKTRLADGEMAANSPTTIVAEGMFDGEILRWSLTRTSASIRSRTSTSQLKTLRLRTKAVRERLDNNATGEHHIQSPLPLIAYYGTGRLWAEERLTITRRRNSEAPIGRRSGYLDFASSTSSFKTFSSWYGDMAFQLRSSTLTAVNADDSPARFLSCVRQAVSVVLEPTGWSTLDWEWIAPLRDTGDRWRREGYVVLEHVHHGRHPLSRMSDGVRNTVALVADIARRCVRLNPQLGEAAAQLTPGVLLIDEIDMHLHPGWQQQVVELIQQAFPLLQFIFTTHSPQVLSTVSRESIRIISISNGDCTLDLPQYQTRGVESADVLARVMGVHSIPQMEETHWLSRYRSLIQQGSHEIPEAIDLWDRLLDHFGSEHPVMQEIDALKRFQHFKYLHSAKVAE